MNATLKQRLFGRLQRSGGSLSLAAQPRQLIITKAFPKLPAAPHGPSRGLPSTEAARPD